MMFPASISMKSSERIMLVRTFPAIGEVNRKDSVLNHLSD